MSDTTTDGRGNAFVAFRADDALRREVRHLLNLMRMLDPHGGEERNAEWPLQLSGDEDATREVCETLNRLQEMTR